MGGTNRNDGPVRVILGPNGTTCTWAHGVGRGAMPSAPSSPGAIQVSGLGFAAIRRPAEAAVLRAFPGWFPIKPCANWRLKPAHAKGLNVLYADDHAQFSHFGSQANSGPLWDPANSSYGGGVDHDWQGYFEE